MPFLCVFSDRQSAHEPISRRLSDNTFFPLVRQGPETSWHQHQAGPFGIWYQKPTRASFPDGQASDQLNQPIALMDGYADFPGDALPRHAQVAPATDADRIAWLFATGGVEAILSLTGCFFACLIEPASFRMTIVRDVLGGRTGYWNREGRNIRVSSRSALIAHTRDGTPAFDEVFLGTAFSLRGLPPIGRSAFEGIHEILPGQSVTLSNERTETKRSCACPSSPAPPKGLEKQAQCFLDHLQTAVRQTLGAEESIASMLSGGLDSGPVTLLADRALSAADRPPLRAISWTLPQTPEADERIWIEQLGSELRASIEFFQADEMLPFSRLETDLVSADIPWFNPFRSIINRCYESAAELGCEVILNGNAGDLLYASRQGLYIDLYRHFGFRAMVDELSWMFRRHGLYWNLEDPAFKHLLGALSGLQWLRGRQRHIRPAPAPWLTRHAASTCKPGDNWPPESSDQKRPGLHRQIFGQSMAFGQAHEQAFPERFGIERRDPYQNRKLACFMASLPVRSSHFRGRSKFIARAALRGILPEPLRRKVRTGNLNPFFHAGLRKNRNQILRHLNDNPGWQRYVKKDQLIAAVQRTEPTGKDQQLINHCIGYSLWQRLWETNS